MTNHWTSPRTFSQESPPPPGLAISTTVPFYDDSFRCHAGRLPDVDMATGGNEASFEYGKKSTFLFLCPWLSFLQQMYQISITPLNYIFENKQVIGFINLNFFQQT